MDIHVMAFGQIAEIFGSRSLQIHGVDSTDALKKKIETSFPQLKEMQYLIAIDHDIINQDTMISEHSEIALLPPFSGG